MWTRSSRHSFNAYGSVCLHHGRQTWTWAAFSTPRLWQESASPGTEVVEVDDLVAVVLVPAPGDYLPLLFLGGCTYLFGCEVGHWTKSQQSVVILPPFTALQCMVELIYISHQQSFTFGLCPNLFPIRQLGLESHYDCNKALFCPLLH